MEEITKHFHKEDIPWIQGIPIDLYIEDTLTWPYTPNGEYIVKSGYRVGREINLHPTRCSNMEEVNKWWKMIWSLQLPPQMKLFGWRVCHNWLPAKTNLIHRVKKIWKLIPWYKKCDILGEGSMFDLLMSLEKKLDRKWNQLPIMNGIQLLTWIFSAYPHSNPHGDIALKPEATHPTIMKQWQPPEKGSICVNCDAALHENLIGVGIGFIWRNWEGQIISAGMIYMPSMCTVEMAEAWAILEAIKRAPAAAKGPIEIQSDCRAVVD
ncbi:uncharacterized protein LOC133030087 [Cannabis sativa]|uniref:uncharacterized protein LOC133030087 n=1 Tax=Cannabis sativa TaxID=3483 RepID=UPI0029C9C9B7|nr:uncharacterized protein LOC133030087 [Cannabis sativa]